MLCPQLIKDIYQLLAQVGLNEDLVWTWFWWSLNRQDYTTTILYIRQLHCSAEITTCNLCRKFTFCEKLTMHLLLSITQMCGICIWHLLYHFNLLHWIRYLPCTLQTNTLLSPLIRVFVAFKVSHGLIHLCVCLYPCLYKKPQSWGFPVPLASHGSQVFESWKNGANDFGDRTSWVITLQKPDQPICVIHIHCIELLCECPSC